MFQILVPYDVQSLSQTEASAIEFSDCKVASTIRGGYSPCLNPDKSDGSTPASSSGVTNADPPDYIDMLACPQITTLLSRRITKIFIAHRRKERDLPCAILPTIMVACSRSWSSGERLFDWLDRPDDCLVGLFPLLLGVDKMRTMGVTAPKLIHISFFCS